MVKLELEENFAVLTLNRPEKRNSLHPELVKDLLQKLYAIRTDDNVKSVIITGAGTSFCAGADLSYLDQLRSYSSVENEADSEFLAGLFLEIYNFPKPVIAAVNGPAIAGGCGLASVCDFIIADSKNAKFGYSEVKIGFIPAIVSIFLIKKVGEGVAKSLLLSGELFDASKGKQINFVNIISDDVMKDSRELAENLGKNSTLSMEFTKKMINSISSLSAEDAVDYCVRLNTISRSSEDFKKGLNSFFKNKGS